MYDYTYPYRRRRGANTDGMCFYVTTQTVVLQSGCVRVLRTIGRVMFTLVDVWRRYIVRLLHLFQFGSHIYIYHITNIKCHHIVASCTFTLHIPLHYNLGTYTPHTDKNRSMIVYPSRVPSGWNCTPYNLYSSFSMDCTEPLESTEVGINPGGISLTRF